MVLSEDKRERIKQLLLEGKKHDYICKMLKCGKTTVGKINKALKASNLMSTQIGLLVVKTPLSPEKLKNYINYHLENPDKKPDNGLIQAANRFLEIERKLEAEQDTTMIDIDFNEMIDIATAIAEQNRTKPENPKPSLSD